MKFVSVKKGAQCDVPYEYFRISKHLVIVHDITSHTFPHATHREHLYSDTWDLPKTYFLEIDH